MKKIIALDIGGTNTRVALINEKYEIESVKVSPTVVGNTNLFLDSVSKTIKEAIPSFDGVAALAMGVPGRVRYDGFIYALPNIHIENVPLASYLTKEFRLPSYVINDAEVAALAEANVGPYKKAKSLYFVTISTGVGGALTIDGELRNSSYEAGHTMTPYHGEVHEFEHMASGVGLHRLCDMNGLQISEAREFFALVKNKNPLALSVYKDWIKMVADWLEMIYDAFTPEVFTLTGGVMKSSEIFLADLRRAAPHCHLELCGCGQEAGLIGAAVLGFQKSK
ncbi:MAG: ROK family protein [Bacilli bacterium]